MARGSKPGERRGGRKRGVPNRQTRELRALLEANGVDLEKDHPVLFLTRVYIGSFTMPVIVTETTEDGPQQVVRDLPATPELRVKCAAEVANYLEPKRKAIEHTGADGEPLPATPVMILFGPEKEGGDGEDGD